MRWIKVHTGLIDWEWHDNTAMVSTWIHLLIMANSTDKKWHGQVIPRGSLTTTIQALADVVGVTHKQMRNCLEKLKGTGEIDLKGANKYTIITICKYEDYQADNSADGQSKGNQRANKGQLLLDIKNIKKESISRDIDEKEVEGLVSEAQKVVCQRKEKKEYAQRVHLTEKEHSTLVEKYGEEDTRWMIEKLSAFKLSKNKSYSSDYGAINNWVVDRLKEDRAKRVALARANQDSYSNEKYW